MVEKVEEMGEGDLRVKVELKDNIGEVNEEIGVGEKAEGEVEERLGEVKIEMKEGEEREIEVEEEW